MANPIGSIGDLEDIYDLCFIEPEIYHYNLTPTKETILKNIKENYTFNLTGGLDKSKIYLTISHKGNHIGDATISPQLKDHKIIFDVTNTIYVKGKKQDVDNFLKIFRHPELINCWYESGHSIVDERAFKLGFRDVEHKKILYSDFSNFDITKEKPGANRMRPDLTLIGTSNSLFCWVKNHWNGNWLTEDQYKDTSTPTGWLFCDDGAGEKADFIHATEYDGNLIISLIHVKAADSSSKQRRISVGVHDIVLNQAIKNIKHCSRKQLIEQLTLRINDSNKKMCWHCGVKIDAKKFIEFLSAYTQDSKVKYRVVAIQPHTVKSTYESLKDTNIYKQLNILLVNTDNAIRSTGATFNIISSIN